MTNNKEYRSNKRVTAYVEPKVKRRLLLEGRKAKRTMSQEASYALTQYYNMGEK